MRDLVSSLVVPLLAAAAWPAVERWTARAGAPRDVASRLAAALALALVWTSVGGMLLGFTHRLDALAVGAWLLLGALSSIALGGRALPRLRWGLPVLAGALALAAYAAVAALPPWDRDEMVYHLALPRLYAAQGGYVPTDDNIFASLPLGWESVQAALHAFGAAPDRFAPFSPRLVGTWAAVAATLATVGLARALGAGRSSWLAGLLLLAVPTFFEFGSSAYVEPYLMTCTTLAALCAVHAVRGRPGMHAATGIFVGAAIASKYPALGFAAALGLALLVHALRRPAADRAMWTRRWLSFAAPALALGAPFYVRNAIVRGNPVFPMAYGLFDGRGWDEVRAAAYWITLREYGAGEDALEALLVPVRVFFARDFLHGFEGSIGPVVGLGWAAAAALAFRLRRMRGFGWRLALVAGLAVAWTMQWSVSVVQARFYLVAVPLLLALLAAGVRRLRARARAVATATLLAGALAWVAAGLHHVFTRQPTVAWWTGEIDDAGVLRTMLPESYTPMRELERWVPPNGKVWLVWMRDYTYYLRRPSRIDCVFEEWRFDELLDRAASPDAFAAAMARDGVTHLLANGARLLQGAGIEIEPGRGDRLRSRFATLLASGVVRPVQQWGDVVLFAIGAPGS